MMNISNERYQKLNIKYVLNYFLKKFSLHLTYKLDFNVIDFELVILKRRKQIFLAFY